MVLTVSKHSTPSWQKACERGRADTTKRGLLSGDTRVEVQPLNSTSGFSHGKFGQTLDRQDGISSRTNHSAISCLLPTVRKCDTILLYDVYIRHCTSYHNCYPLSTNFRKGACVSLDENLLRNRLSRREPGIAGVALPPVFVLRQSQIQYKLLTTNTTVRCYNLHENLTFNAGAKRLEDKPACSLFQSRTRTASSLFTPR